MDPGSAGGYLYPLGLFMASGIMPADFREIAFSPGPGGKQEKVVLAVYAGKYDIGTIREGTLEVVRDKVDIGEIRVVASTPRYPGWVYAGGAGLAPAVVEKIQNAIGRLDYDKGGGTAGIPGGPPSMRGNPGRAKDRGIRFPCGPWQSAWVRSPNGNFETRGSGGKYTLGGLLPLAGGLPGGGNFLPAAEAG